MKQQNSSSNYELLFAEFLTRQIRPLCCDAKLRQRSAKLLMHTLQELLLYLKKRQKEDLRRFFALKRQLKETVEFPSPKTKHELRRNKHFAKYLCQLSRSALSVWVCQSENMDRCAAKGQQIDVNLLCALFC